MAEVRLADTVIPTPVFERYVAHRILERNAFWNSGVIVTNPQLDARAKAGQGQTVNMPFFQAIDTSVEPNISTDDPAQVAVPQKIGAGEQVARKLMLNQHWASMDIVPSMIGEDPIRVLGNQVGDYWSNTYSKYLISSAVGVLADNIANDNGDMVVEAGGPITGDVIIDARQTKGDRKRDFTAIGMHSAIHTALEKQQLIETIRDADNNTLFEVYNGMLVVMDDSLPENAGTYTSVLLGRGSWLLGTGAPKVPLAQSREELVGNGEGEELIHSRRHLAIHPDGFSYVGTPASQSATRAELEVATAWDRVYAERKRIDMAFITSTI